MPLRPTIARTDKMHPVVREYVLADGEVPEANDIVHLDANQEVVRTTAADPTPLLGLAQESHDGAIMPGKILVAVFTEDLVLKIRGSAAPALDDINVAYGLVRDADGVWTLDKSETVATRVFVVDVDVDAQWYFVKVLAAHRQSPE